jgi:hypothetical protein
MRGLFEEQSGGGDAGNGCRRHGRNGGTCGSPTS